MYKKWRNTKSGDNTTHIIFVIQSRRKIMGNRERAKSRNRHTYLTIERRGGIRSRSRKSGKKIKNMSRKV